jgi:hypothetical protein
VRVEVQWKGESLPDGTPVNVSAYQHKDINSTDFLKLKSTRTVLREGAYNTSSVLVEKYDNSGVSTGEFIAKSVVDIEITHPTEPDWIDIYVYINYLGFFVDGIHSARFIGTLFMSTDVNIPFEDGIDVSEQFATVWTLDPDNTDLTVP